MGCPTSGWICLQLGGLLAMLVCMHVMHIGRLSSLLEDPGVLPDSDVAMVQHLICQHLRAVVAETAGGRTTGRASLVAADFEAALRMVQKANAAEETIHLMEGPSQVRVLLTAMPCAFWCTWCICKQ